MRAFATHFSRRLQAAPLHTIVVLTSYWIALLLRFDFKLPPQDVHMLYRAMVIVVALKVLMLTILDPSRQHWWRQHGLGEVLLLLRNNIIASFTTGVVIYSIIGAEFPRSVYLLDLLICFLISGAGMFALRIYMELTSTFRHRKDAKGFVIYGAGVAGIALAREVRDNPKLGFRVCGFLDDDPRKWGMRILGFPVLGAGADAERVVSTLKQNDNDVSEVVVAMPSATGDQIRLAVQNGKSAGVPCRIVPGLGQLISGKSPFGRMQEIAVTDILGRDPVELDLKTVRHAIQGHSVMVTGAAGSIGSELCHQIAEFEPRRLIAYDQAETELFKLENELRARFPLLHLIPQVGDIRDSAHVDLVINENAVNSIFHAAAYKHVPMMERQVCEAVRNNIIGTWNVVQAAWRANVSNFLLISTDKAVNPTSVMGLTKRVTELLVSAQRSNLGRGPSTRFVAVRFGNVLVSNGSVVPTFQKQIAAGGPITVTHPEMQRYFMTVREAAQLVLQASTMGRGSEIFVLDMGTPVKIIDLARRMITLAGFVPDRDIEIRISGLRPGEKLFEELSFAAEDIVETTHPRIRVFRGKQTTFEDVVPWINKLQHLLWQRDLNAIVEHMRLLVPEYQPMKGDDRAPARPVAARLRPKLVPSTSKS